MTTDRIEIRVVFYPPPSFVGGGREKFYSCALQFGETPPCA
jgi:hypothetical protein